MKDTRLYSRRRFLNHLGGLAAWGLLGSVSHHLLAGNQDGALMDQEKTESNVFMPGYLALHRRGELKVRAEILHARMQHCDLCPRDCGTDRISGQRGDCKSNAQLEVSAYHPHFGEEKELVGSHGSGTIFFTNCSLLCVFCINAEISQMGYGQRQRVVQLARQMLDLQRMGCHNINLVTPSHYIPHILYALDIAAARGLRLPIVYNTCGWEKKEVLDLLDGVVDIYLADFKYFDGQAASKYSPGALSYPEITQAALIEMHRQVGVAQVDPKTQRINKGLMIRHLVMPNNVAGSDRIMRWIAQNLPKNTYVNIMSQYTPVFNATDYPEIARRIQMAEYRSAVDAARHAGLTNLRLQGG